MNPRLDRRYLAAMLALAVLAVGLLGTALLLHDGYTFEQLQRLAAASQEAVRGGLPTAEIAQRIDALRGQIDVTGEDRARVLMMSLAALALVSIGLTAASAALIARQYERPLSHLANLTEEIGRGGRPPALPTDRPDEIGGLARALGTLALDLERTTVSRDKFDLILANMRDGLAVTDRAGRITDANPAFLRLAGRGQDDVVGRSIRAFLTDHPGSPARSLDSFETGFRVETGAPTPILLSSSPIEDAHGDLQGAVYVLHDITERKRAEDRVRHLAHHDLLTGLPNRALLADRLQLAIARARREGRELAVLLLDLDHFKSVNDTLGHTAGDEILKRASARIAELVRASDTVARFGGDEFVVLQAVQHVPSDVEALCQRLVEVLDQPLEAAEREVRLGVSVGIAIYPQDGAGLDPLLRAADRALYAAKQAGRSTWRYANRGLLSASGPGRARLPSA
jgi:diguanylate cyclase (GGDEF)-like protein/PAS domain S-box-containing protein